MHFFITNHFFLSYPWKYLKNIYVLKVQKVNWKKKKKTYNTALLLLL